MITIIDNANIRFYFEQFKAAGFIPTQVKFDSVTFERGGSILIDGAIDLPVVGGFDVKLKLVAKLLADSSTIRLRIVDVRVSGIGSRALVMLFLSKIAENLTVAGLRYVTEATDGYLEYSKPQKWILLKGIQTDENQLSVAYDIDVPAMMKELQATQIETMKSSNSMADKVNASRLENPLPPITGTGAKAPEMYTTPKLSGAVNLANSF